MQNGSVLTIDKLGELCSKYPNYNLFVSVQGTGLDTLSNLYSFYGRIEFDIDTRNRVNLYVRRDIGGNFNPRDKKHKCFNVALHFHYTYELRKDYPVWVYLEDLRIWTNRFIGFEIIDKAYFVRLLEQTKNTKLVESKKKLLENKYPLVLLRYSIKS